MTEKKPVIIPLKSGQVHFKDIIELDDGQLSKIVQESVKKTKKQWSVAENGVPVPLTSEQISDVLDFKNEVVSGLTAEDMIDDDILDVLPHAKKRINYRLEGHDPDTPLNRKKLVKLAQSIIDATEVKGAQWKGRNNLSYRFLSTYNNKSIEIALAFTDAVVIITIIVPKGGPSKKDPGFSIRELIASKTKKSSPMKK